MNLEKYNINCSICGIYEYSGFGVKKVTAKYCLNYEADDEFDDWDKNESIPCI